MFPDRPACEADAEAIEELVKLMERRQGTRQNLAVPAGFTYLGQFIDHDLTFDPTPVAATQRDPRALVDFRTPRLDLDSVYGFGPAAQPFLYDWKESAPPGTRLLVGHNAVDATDDLPRNQQGRALIGDARNDENVIVAQLHLLFIRFHNAVVDHLVCRGTPDGELFEKARRIVRRHYQWIVVNEFLPKVVGTETANRVLAPAGDGTAPTIRREFFKWQREPFVPVEFSGAAYRFGHSMVRNDYGIKRLPPSGSGRPAIPLFPDLAGFTWLAQEHVIDWERFFELDRRAPQASSAIDTAIAPPLFNLPEGDPKLPRRNLLRGRRLGLPSGQEVACAMHAPALAEEELRVDKTVEPLAREVLLRSTPLWYYILCEAERKGHSEDRGPEGRHLGPVGGRIVAEVLVGLLEGDPSSYLSEEPSWRPGELDTGDDFTMAMLVTFARRAAIGSSRHAARARR
ncbi:MAG: peroxidase [Thermoleophilaceae bacterium]|nr:peroxidase [Thermoleophilaceae bacterium]